MPHYFKTGKEIISISGPCRWFLFDRGTYFEVLKHFQKDSLTYTAVKTKSCCKPGVRTEYGQKTSTSKKDLRDLSPACLCFPKD